MKDIVVSDVKEQLITRLKSQIATWDDPSYLHAAALQYSLAEMVTDLIGIAYGNYDEGLKDLIGELIVFIYYHDYDEAVAELNKYLESRKKFLSQAHAF
jgi:hypothetical protein